MIEDEWWDATRERRLVVQRCPCGHVQHYPRELCTGCGGTSLTFTGTSGHGTVDSFTAVHRAPSREVEVPYTVARVRLAEGPIILTHLDGPGPWACDEPVRLGWRPLPDGRNLPVFMKEA
jgi:uncharacterized OB-fold protein